jgi:class 3 adenylate cyclase
MKERMVKPGLPIPKIGHVEAFAMIVDLNGFTPMVEKAECANDSIAQFTRDALAGAIFEIEAQGGEVVGFMGDAILGILPDGDSAVKACFGIAKDTDRLCEWISNCQAECNGGWEYAPGGPSLKISVEYGRMDVSTIDSRLLGEHRLLIGNPINYAARIAKAGEGNRCIIGPAAAKREFANYQLTGPVEVSGKPGELPYECYFLDLSDIWIEGPRDPGKETFWG